MPEVSVIIPAYNAERFLSEAIESVLNQSLDNVECVVVDDGSTDGTATIAGQFSDRVVYLHQQNSDRSVARNNGIKHASGKYVCFLDADDSLLPEKLADQWQFLETHDEFDAVYSKVVNFYDDNGRDFYQVRRQTPQGDILPQLIWGNFIPIHAPLIRKAALERSGLFNPDFNRYEDWDLFLRLVLTGTRFAYLDSIGAYCRVHSGNTVQDKVKMYAAKIEVAKQIVGSYAQEISSRDINADVIVAFHEADYGRMLVLNEQVNEGLAYLERACLKDIPHRLKFKAFGTVAKYLGAQPLISLTKITDRVRKYRSVKI